MAEQPEPQFPGTGEQPSLSPPEGRELTARQQALVEALDQRVPSSHRIVQMYREALDSIQRGGPESLNVAAYELREMMDWLTRVLEVPRASRDETNDRISRLADVWASCDRNSTAKDGDRWSGSIDGPLRELLGTVQVFMEWRASSVATRREESGMVLARLSGHRVPTSGMATSHGAELWTTLFRYFNRILHHNTTPARQEFEDQVGALEELLFNKLRPTPTVDLDQIDDLLSGGETS